VLETLKASGDMLKQLGATGQGLKAVEELVSELESSIQSASDITTVLSTGSVSGMVNSMQALGPGGEIIDEVCTDCKFLLFAYCLTMFVGQDDLMRELEGMEGEAEEEETLQQTRPRFITGYLQEEETAEEKEVPKPLPQKISSPPPVSSRPQRVSNPPAREVPMPMLV
jgi:hypothetical protein